MIVDLITDRTQSDAAYAATHRDSPEPLKGAYNAEDFNRVGRALNYLSDWLYSLGYGVNPQLRAEWGTADNLSYQDATIYLEKIRQLKESFYVFLETPPLPGDIHELFDEGGHEKANAIEKTLADIDIIIERMERGYRKLGTFKLNQKAVLPQR